MAIANLSTKKAIALSKSIQIGEPALQIELAKASGWETLTDIWVGANHQGNTWQYPDAMKNFVNCSQP